jgi:glycosyltransferase involved in cell wall biosynthesis
VPDVSVIIPTRNRPHLARQAIDSALAQEHVTVEVIAVDDASTDDTALQLQGVDDPRFTLVTREARGYLGGARNSGLERAHGEWVAFLDDDDLWSPEKLRHQIDAAVATDAGFVYSGGLVVDVELRPLHILRVPDPATILPALLQLNVIPAGASNVVAQRSLVCSLEGFDERFSHSADWDLWIRLAAVSRAAAVPELLVAYRLHASGQSSELGAELLQELDLMDEKHAALRDHAGVSLDREAVASWVEKRTRQVAEQHVGRIRRLARRKLRPPKRASEIPQPPWLRPS